MTTAKLNQKVNAALSERQDTDMSLRSEEGNQQNKEIYSSEPIEDTPFNVITNNDTGEKFVSFGNYRMPQKHNAEEYVEKIKNKDWSVIMDVIVIFMDIAAKKNIIK